MSFGDLDERDRAILTHLARYRLTFQEILGVLFFDGKSPQSALTRLIADGYLEAVKGYGGNRRGYKLSVAGARAAGLGRRRGDHPGSEAGPFNLAVLTFCLLNGRPRIRLENSELEELFDGKRPPGRCHCLESSTKAKRVYHVYVPGERTEPGEIARQTCEHAAKAVQLKWMQPWLNNDVYAFAVLADSANRLAAIKTALDEAKLASGQLLPEAVPIHVELVPGPAPLGEALHDLAQ